MADQSPITKIQKITGIKKRKTTKTETKSANSQFSKFSKISKGKVHENTENLEIKKTLKFILNEKELKIERKKDLPREEQALNTSIEGNLNQENPTRGVSLT